MIEESSLHVLEFFFSLHPYIDTVTYLSAYAECLHATMASLSPIASPSLPATSLYLLIALGPSTHVIFFAMTLL